MSRNTSSHPEHTKKSIIYCQTLRLSRLGSIDKEMLKVKFNFSKKINPNEKKEKGVSQVITYHPSINCLIEIIRDNLHLLHMNDKVKKVFSPKSMISFRSTRKLSCYLVRDKLYPIERTVGSFKCTKQC